MYDRESESEFQVYVGHHNDSGQKEGQGTLKLESDRLYKYNGKMVRDNFHGDGVYTQIKYSNNFSFNGTLYANTFEGYGNIIHGNCVYFEGLFSKNKRFGPGVTSHIDGTQDVGFWNGPDLMRLVEVVNQNSVPKMARTTNGQIEILKNRKLINLTSEGSHSEQFIKNTALNNPFIRNERSFFFDYSFYDDKFNFKMIPIKEQRKVCQENKENKDCSPKEQCLLLQKQRFLEDSTTKITVTESESSKSPKSDSDVEVSDLLVWNNEDYLSEVLLKCFKHRNREHTVKFLTSKLLRKQRQLFRAPGSYEVACRLFLRACMKGDYETMTKLHTQYLINPDVSDSEGNSGIIYAAANDNIYIIRKLVNVGGKLDLVNDENITALNMCLLRYISQYRDITDWENAFLINPEYKNDGNDGKEWLGQKLEDIALSSYHNYLQNKNITAEKEALILNCLKDVVTGEKFKHFSKLKLNNSGIFEPKEDSKQSYLFNWNLKSVSIKAKTKKQKKNKKKAPKVKINVTKLAEEVSLKTDCEKKLDIILYTIRLLLKLGANPNLCNIPQPTVIMALYCECPKLLETLIFHDITITDVYTADKLNLLHIVCSMPPTENLAKLTTILLNNRVNPLERCSPNHWSEEIDKIRGDVKPEKKSKKSGLSKELPNTLEAIEEFEEEENQDEFNLGKTPLHILALKRDFDTDPTHTDEDYQCVMAKVIGISNPAVLEALYLEHSPLSLAVLRGNARLVQALLDVGADPNFNLPNGMGTALTLYCLKRYSKPKMLPPVAICKRIMDILIIRGGNPLQKIGKFQNAIEFIIGENDSNENRDKKENKKAKKDKKSTKDTKSNPSKSKKSSKIKNKKMTPQKELSEYLLQLAQDVILTHQQSKIAMLFLNKLMEGTVEDFKHLLGFLTKEDGLRLIKTFCAQEILNLTDDAHYFLSYLLLECIDLYGSQAKSAESGKIDKKTKTKKDKDSKTSKKSKKSKTTKGSKKSTKSKESKKVKHESSAIGNIGLPIRANNQNVLDAFMETVSLQTHFSHFPFDVDRANLEVCYQCGVKTGKTLLCCPKCGLVYFCSQKCNLADTKTNSRHPCKLLFYDHEFKKMEDKDAICINNLEVTFNRLPMQIPTSQNIKEHKMFMDLLSAVKEKAKRGGSGSLVTVHDEKVSKLLEAMNLKIDISTIDLSRTREKRRTSEDIKRSLREILPISFTYIPGRISMTSNYTDSFRSILTADDDASLINTIFTKHGSASNLTEHSDLHFNLRSMSVVSSLNQKPNSSLTLPNIFISSGESESTVIQRERINFTTSERNDSGAKQNKTTDRNLGLKRTRIKDPRVGRDIEFDFTRFSVSQPEKFRSKSKLAFRQHGESKSLVNRQFIRTLSKMFPGFDFTTVMAPFVCLSDSQFYYKFADKFPDFFSTHM